MTFGIKPTRMVDFMGYITKDVEIRVPENGLYP